MALKYTSFLLFTIVLSTGWQNNSFANNNTSEKSTFISAYAISDSFSNILPIKQLIEDDWKQAPANNASKGFTQNEIGVTAFWNNISFNLAHRLDYFVFTNEDTAKAFYLERTDQPLTTQASYQLALKLHNQQSNGFRLGYQWQFEQFSTELSLGYWDVSATRESQIHGRVSGEENNNITGIATLNEFYSDKNFLKRGNDNDWDINGYGITLDLAMHWQITEQFDMSIDIKDLYSHFKMDNLGYSRGEVNTDGTFINSLGGKSYLPLYRGIETSDDHQFSLPEHANLIIRYQGDHTNNATALNYLARFKRQGEANFYYAGVELDFVTSQLSLMLDLEHLSPELQYQSQWLTVTVAIDELDIDKAMQFTLGVALNYHF